MDKNQCQSDHPGSVEEAFAQFLGVKRAKDLREPEVIGSTAW